MTFTFVGEEYRVQVGNTDFFIDLLFYNRALSCLVPIELKIDTSVLNIWDSSIFIWKHLTVM